MGYKKVDDAGAGIVAVSVAKDYRPTKELPLSLWVWPAQWLMWCFGAAVTLGNDLLSGRRMHLDNRSMLVAPIRQSTR